MQEEKVSDNPIDFQMPFLPKSGTSRYTNTNQHVRHKPCQAVRPQSWKQQCFFIKDQGSTATRELHASERSILHHKIESQLGAQLLYDKFRAELPLMCAVKAEIAIFDNVVVLYKFIGDLMFFVTVSQAENELLMYTVLEGFHESVSLLLR